jgi:hypothetical protein
MSGLLQFFVCKPLSTKLSRQACARKAKVCRTGSASWNKRQTHGRHVGEHGIVGTPCRTCEIGAAHLRKEEPIAWPDGTAIEYATIEPGSSRWLGKEPQAAQAASDARSRSDVGELGADPSGGEGAPNQPSLTDPFEEERSEASVLDANRAAEEHGTLQPSNAEGASSVPSSSPRASEGRGKRAPQPKEKRVPYTPKQIEHDGESRTLREWAELAGVAYGTLHTRLKAGWTMDEAIAGKRFASDQPARTKKRATRAVQSKPASKGAPWVADALAAVAEDLLRAEARVDELKDMANRIAKLGGVEQLPFPELGE